MDGAHVTCFDGASQREDDRLGRVEPFVELALAEQYPRADQQLLPVEGLGQEVIRARGKAREARLAIGYVDIEQDQIGLRFLKRLQGGDAVRCLSDVVAELAHALDDELAIDVVVVHDEYPRHGRGHVRTAASGASGEAIPRSHVRSRSGSIGFVRQASAPIKRKRPVSVSTVTTTIGT